LIDAVRLEGSRKFLRISWIILYDGRIKINRSAALYPNERKMELKIELSIV
jgi:hypothetical protein